jgi:hypothetical protein
MILKPGKYYQSKLVSGSLKVNIPSREIDDYQSFWEEIIE